jgi:hypothetical protein
MILIGYRHGLRASELCTWSLNMRSFSSALSLLVACRALVHLPSITP